MGCTVYSIPHHNCFCFIMFCAFFMDGDKYTTNALFSKFLSSLCFSYSNVILEEKGKVIREAGRQGGVREETNNTSPEAVETL